MNSYVELYNRMEDKKVFEKDLLFATLETSVRNIKLPNNKSFLLCDTVGFVSDLPHDLVKAFRSTLEEVCQADLLLHVMDFSNPNYMKQIKVTTETLKQIGAEDIPVIYVYNKIDLVDAPIPCNGENIVYISARGNIGLDELTCIISKKIFSEYKECQMLIPYDKGHIVYYLNENANIKSTVYKTNGTLLTLECRQVDYMRYQQFLNAD